MISWIKKRFDEQRYEFYEDKNFKLNIFIVQKEKVIPGFFDDDIFVVYRDAAFNWKIHQFKVAAQVHKFYKEVFGSYILYPEQYNWQYIVGRLGNEPALINMDHSEGVGAIHCTPPNISLGELPIAGTTLFKRKRDFYEFMKLCKLHKETHGNSFSLNVFTEKQFNTNV